MGLFSKIKNLFATSEQEDKAKVEALEVEKRIKEEALEQQKQAEIAEAKAIEAQAKKEADELKLKEEAELSAKHLAEQNELEKLRLQEKQNQEKTRESEEESKALLEKQALELEQKKKAELEIQKAKALKEEQEKERLAKEKSELEARQKEQEIREVKELEEKKKAEELEKQAKLAKQITNPSTSSGTVEYAKKHTEKTDVENKEEKDLSKGLEKTKAGFFSRLSRAVIGKSKVDDEVLDNLEGMLIEGDVGVNTTLKIIESIEDRVAKDKYVNTSELNGILREEITKLLLGDKQSNEMQAILANKVQGEPYVIMVVGVNGVGKTTTIGKLAHGFKEIGMNVVLGAADTFRAAAVDQIKVWGERAGVPVVAQKMGSDPASVAFDTLQSAKANGADIVLIDTAGRLHNQKGLMNELSKIRNVMKKVVPSAPHEVLLVLDASTGQNAIEQAKQFTAATDVNALALTKLDGTAKGGVVIGISDQFQIPVKYIGVGEGINHLQVFDKKSFVDALFG